MGLVEDALVKELTASLEAYKIKLEPCGNPERLMGQQKINADGCTGASEHIHVIALVAHFHHCQTQPEFTRARGQKVTKDASFLTFEYLYSLQVHKNLQITLYNPTNRDQEIILNLY